MSEIAANRKRIAKNTMALYVRMFISMVIGIYTSRVVLEVLGISDYGIYTIVGSITAMMAFLNATMSGATSRFLSFSIGKTDREELNKTFSSVLIVHIIIAVIFLILAESIGVVVLNKFLVIPEDRMTIANIIYQISIVSCVLSILTTPYTSEIISHERLTFFAYLDIINSVLKLAIVYLLSTINYDKLVLYALLLLAVSVLISLTYFIYCKKNFEEVNSKLQYNKKSIKEIFSFAGYNLIGNIGPIFNTQGTNYCINIFFGITFNAAVGIATTISSTVNSFSANILTAFRPAIIKAYAKDDISDTEKLSRLSIVLSTLLIGLIIVPIATNIKYILEIWLVKVPPLTATFTIFILADLIFLNIRYILTILIHAYGKVKVNSTCSGILYLINPVITYFLLKLGCPAYYAFIGAVIINIALTVLYLFLIKSYIPSLAILRISKSIVVSVVLILIGLIVSVFMKQIYNSDLLCLAGTLLSNSVFLCILFLLFGTNNNERLILKNYLLHFLHKA